MSVPSWIRRWFRPHDPKAVQRPRRTSTRLRVEPLEDRAVPAATLTLLPSIGSTAQAVTLDVDTFDFGIRYVPVPDGPDKATFETLDVSVGLEANAPRLFTRVTTGAVYPTAILTNTNEKGQADARWVMGDVSISALTQTGDRTDATERLSFSFRSMTQAVGGTTASWDSARGLPSGPAVPAAPPLVPVVAATGDSYLLLRPIDGRPDITIPVRRFDFDVVNEPTTGLNPSRAAFDRLNVSAPLTSNAAGLFSALTANPHFEIAALVQNNDRGECIGTWYLGSVYFDKQRVVGDGESPRQELGFAFDKLAVAITRFTNYGWSRGADGDTGSSWIPTTGIAYTSREIVPPEVPTNPEYSLTIASDRTGLVHTIYPRDFTFGFQVPTDLTPARPGFDLLEVNANQSGMIGAFQGLTTGEMLSATLTRFDDAGQPTSVRVLGNVLIAGQTVSGGDDADIQQTVRIAFGSITEATKSGMTSWDRTRNAPTGPALPDGLSLVAPPAPAATGMSLLFTSSSTPSREIPITGYKFGTRINATSGRSEFESLNVTGELAALSPEFLRSVVRQTLYETVTLKQTNAAGQVTAHWVLGNATVSDLDTSGESGGVFDRLTVSFRSMTEAVGGGTAANPTTTAASWNSQTNAATGPALPAGSLAPVMIETTTATLFLRPTNGGPDLTIPVHSYDFATSYLANPVPPANGLTFGRLTIDAPLFAASPALFAAVASGSKFSRATLVQYDAEGKSTGGWYLGELGLVERSVSGDGESPRQELRFEYEDLAIAGPPIGTNTRPVFGWSADTATEFAPVFSGFVTVPAIAAPVAPVNPPYTLTFQPVVSGASFTIYPDDFAFGFRSEFVATGFETRFDRLRINADRTAAYNAFRNVIRGTPFTATLTRADADGRPNAVWVLGAAVLASQNTYGGDGEEFRQALEIAFASLTMVTNPNTASWNLATGQATGPNGPHPSTLVSLNGPLIVNNVASVSVLEGATATNAGSFDSPLGRAAVTLTASAGTVTKDNATGTWAWAYTPLAAAGSPTSVTITATDTSGEQTISSFSLAVTPVTATTLQTAIAQQGSVTIQVTTPAQATILTAAVNGLPVSAVPTTVTVNLTVGTFSGLTVAPPAGVTLVLVGNGEATTIVGASPSLLVNGGNVVVRDAVLTNATAAPTIRVTGGTLTLRNVTVRESSTSNQAAVLVTGGTIDLGTVADPGGNTFDVVGAGDLIRNIGTAEIPALGNAFTLNGSPIASGFRVEDRIVHALDANGFGAVWFVGDAVYVTASSGSIARGIAAAAHGTVHVEAGLDGGFHAGDTPVTIAFQNGPTIGRSVDPLDPSRMAFFVTGTDRADAIRVKRTGTDQYEARIDSGSWDWKGTFTGPVGRVVVDAGAGNDAVDFHGSVSVPVWMDGGEGNDILDGAENAPNILLGGSGLDLLRGGNKRDILIGGTGSDILYARGDEDLLIGGPTTLDDAALFGVQVEWTSNRTHSQRVNALRPILLTPVPVVYDDNAPDLFVGGSGRDWFLGRKHGPGRDLFLGLLGTTIDDV